MSRTGKTGSTWRRPQTRMYDYNYKLGENYYADTLAKLDNKPKGSSASSSSNLEPSASSSFSKVFGDRFGEGGAGERKSIFGDDLPPRPSFAQRRSSLNEEDGKPSRTRFTFGDRLLNAVGVSGSSSALIPRNPSEDPFADEFFSVGAAAKSKRQLGAMDDAFFEGSRSKLTSSSARSAADNMMEDMRKDSEASSTRFRARMKAAQEASNQLVPMSPSSGDFDFGSKQQDSSSSAALSKVDQIRQRARARLAELEEDFPAIDIRGANNRGGRESSFSRQQSLSSSQAQAVSSASKSIRVTQRTVKSTISSDYD